jgi:hypothetical protein
MSNAARETHDVSVHSGQERWVIAPLITMSSPAVLWDEKSWCVPGGSVQIPHLLGPNPQNITEGVLARPDAHTVAEEMIRRMESPRLPIADT